MAENQGKLGACLKLADDIASEWQALSAFGFATHLRIGGLSTPDLAAPRDIAQIIFLNCVADTNDHVRILLNNPCVRIVRHIRNKKIANGSHS